MTTSGCRWGTRRSSRATSGGQPWSPGPQSANGGLNRSSGLAWGPDGNLYVGSLNTDQVLRFDGTSGAFLGAFVSAGSGGLDGPAVQGLHFRPDGKLYVLSRDNAQVLRYDAALVRSSMSSFRRAAAG